MATIGPLAIKITTDHREAERGFQVLETKVIRFTESIESRFARFAQKQWGFTPAMKGLDGGSGDGLGGLEGAFGAIGRFAPAAAGILSVGKLVGDLARTAEQMKLVTVQAREIGLSVEEFQRLDKVALAAGGSIENVVGGITKLEKAIGEAAQGSKPMQEALAKIGLSAKTLLPMDTEEQLRTVAKAIEGIESPAIRMATILAIFGKGGREMIPVLEAMASGADKTKSAISGLSASALSDFVRTMQSPMKTAKTAYGEMAGGLLRMLGFGESAETIRRAAKERHAIEVEAAAILERQEQTLKRQAETEKQIAEIGKMRVAAGEKGLSFRDTLRSRIEGMGMTAEAADITRIRRERDEWVAEMEKAAFSGALGPNGLEWLDAAIKETDALVKRFEKMSQLTKQWDIGKGLLAATQTPAEKLDARLEELDRLAGLPGLQRDIFKRAIARSAFAAQREAMPNAGFRFAAGGSIGSSQAYETLMRATTGGPANDRKVVLDELKEHTKVLGNLRKLIGDAAGNLVVVQPADL